MAESAVQPHIEHFIDKLIVEYKARRTTEAILLTHNHMAWFQKIARTSAANCFTCGRIGFERFDDKTGRAVEIGQPTQGQIFSYFGRKADRFSAVFESQGAVL